ncbi:MAG: hypothetical protein LUG18_07765 [Candidatus Azobacteroides sp.]|nr:hypothetical protein [Candidatus Azobacteroides sp.]
MHSFASYLSRQKEYNFISSCYSNFDVAIIIPCFNELNINLTIQTLLSSVPPALSIHLIIVINSPQCATNEQRYVNRVIYSDIIEILNNLPDSIGISVINIENIPVKLAGAGYARKVGMDEAIRLFYEMGNLNGILISLDADCLIKNNYLQIIYDTFRRNKKINTAIIHFEHILSSGVTDADLLQAGYLYELYLRYYKEALRYIGFPWYYHTIGSAFAVKAATYVKAGGMNKKNAGEDFYFLHKVFPLGGVIEINETTVYPEIRLSDRVVFGTGPAIKKIMAGKDICWETYSLEAFMDLKLFFDNVYKLYRITEKEFNLLLKEWPVTIRSYFEKTGMLFEKIREINANTSTGENFRKRFFEWFNAFQIIKFMHFVHPAFYPLKKTEILVVELWELIFGEKPENETEVFYLLEKYRKLQTGQSEDFG